MTGLYKAAYPYADDVLALPVQGHRPGHEAIELPSRLQPSPSVLSRKYASQVVPPCR